MSWDFSVTTYQVAKKDYPCDAMEYIGYAVENDFTQKERDIIENARQEGNMILKGMRYLKVTGKWEGEMCTFRARPEIHKICKEYELYPDD